MILQNRDNTCRHRCLFSKLAAPVSAYTRRVLILMGCLITQIKLREQSQGYQAVSERFFLGWPATEYLKRLAKPLQLNQTLFHGFPGVHVRSTVNLMAMILITSGFHCTCTLELSTNQRLVQTNSHTLHTVDRKIFRC